MDSKTIGDIVGFGGLVILPLTIWLLCKTGVIETPQRTRARKWREADAALSAQEEHETLSPEGKLLHKLTEQQAKTEANTRAIFGVIMGGAIGYLVFYFWLF